jgi:hypothetical protein
VAKNQGNGEKILRLSVIREKRNNKTKQKAKEEKV